ncbi:DUF748 domain-containing protein [Vibrio fluminensis]|uniref:DUF748 domain-containing protein n=1 Tax=Vibrio fluminensis TaxID=2783614 RepID=UPI00188822ED|nr:DUF748 domain-containing protein [Vibrio fluminensis]
MSSKFSQAVTKFRALPRAVRWATYSAGGYLTYAALVGALVPYVAQQQVPKQLSNLIERPVQLGKVTINPFTLQVSLDQFAILEGDKPFVKFNQAALQVNFWQSILNGHLELEYIKLDQPFVNIERLTDSPQTTFNFSDILAAVEKNSSAVEESEPQSEEVVDRNAPLFPVYIKQTALTGGEVYFRDAVTDTELAYPDINVTLSEFATQNLLDADSKVNHYSVAITDSDSARLALSGQVQLKPLRVSGDVEIEHIQLPRLWRFAEHELAAKLTSGEFNFASQYVVNQTIGDTPEQDTLTVSTHSGELAVNQVNFDANGKSVVSLKSFVVAGIAADTESQQVKIDAVRSQGLAVSAKVDAKGADLATIFTPKSLAQSTSSDKETAEKQAAASDKSNSEAQASATKPWLVTLGGIELKEYALNIEESLLTKKPNKWQVAPINLSTKQIISDLSQPIDFALSASINGKGDLNVEGQADAIAQSVNADIAVKQLKLAQFQPYIATALNATLTSGEFTANTKLSADATGKVVASGSAAVNHLSVRDNKLKKPFVKWQSLAVNKFDFDLNKSKLDIDTLSLSQPYARVVINKDRSTNIGDLVVEQPKSAKSKTQSNKANKASDSKPFALKVRKVSFKDGSAFFADNSLTPNFSSGIEQLRGSIGDISSIPGTKASVDISGSIDRYAPVKVKGEINPLIAKPYLDLDVLFKSIELTTVNPYSGTYAGHYIDKGQLTLALNYKLENNQLKGSNHVVVDQLQLGKASESDLATDLPIKLAIALLQDSDGVIDLGMDVSGDVNDPEFSVGAVIWQTLSNIITKAVTAPFSFIAGLADADDELNEVSFDFGVDQLNTEQQEKLAQLGEALETRPMLTLSVDGSVDAVEDSKALALAKFDQLLASQANMTIEQLPQDLSASSIPVQGPLSEALIATYQQEFGVEADTVRDTIEQELDNKDQDYTDEELDRRWHIALYNLVLNKQEVTPAELGQLAQRRAQAVKAYLVDVTQVDASRVFLLDSRFDVDQDASMVTLSLEVN